MSPRRVAAGSPAGNLGLLLVLLAVSFAAAAASPEPVELQSVQFPDRRNVSLPFQVLSRAPAARVSAQVSYREGQARVRVTYDSMKPAIVFGGEVTCYVLWALTRDGVPENLGEFVVREPRGNLDFSTGKKNFALMVTAESYSLVGRPSGLVMFLNTAPDPQRASSRSFSFSGLGPVPEHAMDSIAHINWESSVSLELLKARKVLELAARYEAPLHAAQLYEEAREALARAEVDLGSSPGSRKGIDAARLSLAVSSEAIHVSRRRRQALDLESDLERRRAETEELERRTAEAEEKSRQAARDLARVKEQQNLLAADAAALIQERSSLEAAMTDVRREKFALEEAAQELQREKDQLDSRLKTALSHVAETRDSARGFVVNLPDILFGVNESTLKPEARVVIAKLTGILLVLPVLQVTVEGHTDASGSARHNLELSQKRAESVLDFMLGEGVEAQRLSAIGYGMERPVADNDTRQGRRENRRVEIVISGG